MTTIYVVIEEVESGTLATGSPFEIHSAYVDERKAKHIAELLRAGYEGEPGASGEWIEGRGAFVYAVDLADSVPKGQASRLADRCAEAGAAARQQRVYVYTLPDGTKLTVRTDKAF